VRRKDNSWSYRVDLGPDPSTGRRRQLAKQGFRTKREAERALDEVLHAVPKGGTPSRSAITLEEYLDQWLEAQRPRIRPTTWYGYAMAVKRLSTGLGKLRLQALTSAQIEAFYSSQLATGRRDGLALSPKTVRNTHVVRLFAMKRGGVFVER
jgi:hypothetical protein